MKKLQMTIGAGEFSKQGVTGNYIYIKDSSGEVNIISNDVGTDNSIDIDMQGGDEMQLETIYKEFYFKNNSIASITLTVIIGVGSFTTNVLYGVVQSRALQMTNITQHRVLTLAGVQQELVAADSNRQGVRFFNNSGVPVYIGGAGVDDSNGLQIQPKAIFVDEASAAAQWFVHAGSADLPIHVQEIS